MSSAASAWLYSTRSALPEAVAICHAHHDGLIATRAALLARNEHRSSELTRPSQAKSVAKTAKTKATGAVKAGKKACIPPGRSANVNLTSSQETTPKATKPKATTTETAAAS